jgi:tetratricopeptide (TPR) repeat protein
MTILPQLRLLPAAEIHDAVEAEDAAKVEQLLTANPGLVKEQTSGGATALHLAAGLNNKKIVSLLIEKGADINLKTKQGWTPLHWAAHMNAADSVALLLAKGADAKAESVDGKTPLQIAMAENAQAVSALFLKATPAAYEDKALNVTFENGEKARTSGDLKQAYEILNKLVNEDPANEQYNFALGLTCYSMKDFSRGQLAFERVLQKNPENQRARLELARCLMALGQDSAARKEFEKIMATNPPKGVQDNIRTMISQLDRRVKKWQFSGRVDAIGFRDDNVNVGPDSATINISPIIFGSMSISNLTVQQASMPADASGYAGSVYGGAVYDCGDPGKWTWGANATYYQNWMSDRSQNEVLYYQIGVGPRYGAGSSYYEIPIKTAHISYGGNSLVNMYGIYPGYMYVYGPSGDWRFGTLATLENRDYATLDDRDGVYMSASEIVRYYFGPERHSVLMGFALCHDNTSAGAYEYTGTEWQFGLEYKFGWKVTGYGSLRYTTSKYAEREVLAPADRNDTQRQFTIGLNKMITSRWGVDVNYQKTDNTSTFAIYQYDRNVTTFSTFCSF